jgi:hypothetical protein
MANIEAAEETRVMGTAAAPADVLIGIAAPAPDALLRQRVAQLSAVLSAGNSSLRFAVSYAGIEGGGGQLFEGETPEPREEGSPGANPGPLQVIEYTLPRSSGSIAPWLGLSAAYSRLADIAARTGASACAILSPDLAALDARSIQALAEPVLDKRADLAMPLYAPSKFEGLLNSSILYPFSRALYGRRLRYPLGPDFGVSTALLARMGKRSVRAGDVDEEHSVIWPGTEAALSDSAVAQVHLDGRHGAQNEGLDLSTVLGHLAGSLFNDAEKHPVVWQRIRGSQPGLVLGEPGVAVESNAVDVQPMIEGFHLASRNLQEVWSLVLPPVTLLELKRLGRAAPEHFRIADGLWARIIYDFALAYRLRTLSRPHLLGALTPLYLGWVASYAQEIAGISAAGAELRVEKLAKAYEDEKSYFVSRWRWPDRFNP